MDIVKAKLDIIFKKLFTSDNEVLKAFVADMLDMPKQDIQEIKVENPNLMPALINGKQSQLDLKMFVDDMVVNVEIQLCNKGNFRERSLYYWSKIYTDDLQSGEDYSLLKKTISINILNFNLFKCDTWYSKFQLLEEKRHEPLTDKFMIMFCELKKVNGKVDTKDRKKMWLQLINAETEEELNMLEKTGVPEINKAVVILHKMSADEEMREMARLREIAIRDEISAMNTARKEGIEQGISKGKQEIIDRMRADGLPEDLIRKYET